MIHLFATIAAKVFVIVVEATSRGPLPFAVLGKILLIGHATRAITAVPHIPRGYASDRH